MQTNQEQASPQGPITEAIGTGYALRQRAKVRVTVEFKRHFTKGNLVGLDHDDSISFVDRWHAENWIRGVNRNSASGLLDYTLTEWRIIDYVGRLVAVKA